MANEDRGDAILYSITELRNRSGIQAFQRIHFISPHYIKSLVSDIKKALENFAEIKETFVLIIEMFDYTVHIYNEYCVCNPIREIREIGRDKVPEKIRETYNTNREAYIRFLESYTNFVKKVNKQFGEDLLRTSYYEKPEVL